MEACGVSLGQRSRYAAILAALDGYALVRVTGDVGLDVDRLERALASSVLMQRYAAYANGSPTLRHGTPEFHAKEWAPFIAREYGRSKP